MLFLISGSKHADGKTWQSPYAKQITHRAVAGVPDAHGWHRSSIALPAATPVLGVWIMADGDDTKARFETRLRNLLLLVAE